MNLIVVFGDDLVDANGMPVPEGTILVIGESVIRMDRVLLKLLVRAVRSEASLLSERLQDAALSSDQPGWWKQVENDRYLLKKLQHELEVILYAKTS